jgi:hypothetical protein
MAVCHVETFREDATREWGWQCFTCPREFGGFPTMAAAEAAGDAHTMNKISPDLDHARCPDVLRNLSVETGCEITVSLARPLVAGPYETGSFTCPHGTTYYIEPTGEQIAAWARGGVR